MFASTNLNPSMNKFQGQQVLVLGGSSGIGLAVARLVQAQGATVSITSSATGQAQAVAEKFGFAHAAAFDIANEAAVYRYIEQFERIDHIYVAAGSTLISHLVQDALAPQLAAIDARLKGSVYVIRAAVPKIRPLGSVTLTGGLSTDRPVPGAWVSSVATAAAEQLARSMALELPPVRFNAISPGFTDTPMWDKVLGQNKDAVLASVATKLLTSKVATATEVAEAVLLLMYNESITGEIIHVDNGGRLV